MRTNISAKYSKSFFWRNLRFSLESSDYAPAGRLLTASVSDFRDQLLLNQELVALSCAL